MATTDAGKTPEEIHFNDLPADFIKACAKGYGDCPHRFLKCEDGITSFDVFTPEGAEGPRKICVLSHGLGGKMGNWDDHGYPQKFMELGYTVVYYSFYGHGWSWGDKQVLTPGCGSGGYTPEVFLRQVKSLLNYVCPGEPVDLWVGHSTGGLVGGLVAQTGTWQIKNLAFAAPAFWTSKSCFSRVLEALHPCSSAFMVKFPIEGTVKDEFAHTIKMAFGKTNPDDKQYLYQERFDVCMKAVDAQFTFHPQVARAIFSVSSCMLCGSVVNKAKADVLKYLASSQATRAAYIWGDLDLVVPYKECHVDVEKCKASNVKLVTLEGIGHECFWEDKEKVFQAIKAFVEEQ